MRPTGLEPVTYGLAYHYSFHCTTGFENPPLCGLDYIFTISGGARIVSTDPLQAKIPVLAASATVDTLTTLHAGRVSSVLPAPALQIYPARDVKVPPIQCPALSRLLSRTRLLAARLH